MQASAPIIVHVVSNATDWPSIAAVISTGIVGVLGVGSAIWQATRGWRREDTRQHRAEKRRVYVRTVDTLQALMGEAVKMKAFEDGRRHEDTLVERRAELNNAADASAAVMGSLLLIAPDDVTVKAQEVAQFIYAFIERPDGPRPGPAGMAPMPRGWISLLQQLVSAMRADLGESPAQGLVASGLVAGAGLGDVPT